MKAKLPEPREYLRDGRSPIPKGIHTSKVMSANKARNTKPELQIKRALYRYGLKGYRSNLKNLPGRPDIAYPKDKVAIFVHGCFWHRCPHCKQPLPRTHKDFWKEKFRKNKLRDKRKANLLEEQGWRVFVFWECEVKNMKMKLVQDVAPFIRSAKAR